MNPKIISENIKKFRTEKNMTQQELAEKIFVTDKAVSKWETGAGLPDIQLMAPLAIALGVTAQDLVTDTSSHTAIDKLFIWSKKKNLRIGAIAILLVLLFGLFGINTMWSRFISDNFDPFLYNETLQAVPSYNRRVETVSRMKHRWYDDRNGSGYRYQISLPPRLAFRGYFVMYDFLMERNITLSVFINRGEWSYRLTLSVRTEGEQNSYTGYSSPVDKNGRPLDLNWDDYDDPEREYELHNIWLGLYDKFYDDIMQMLATAKEVFGEEAFR